MLKKKKNALGLFRKNRSQEEKPSKPVEVRQEQGESQINRAVEFTASGRAHSLFFAPESEGKDFSSVLADVQAYISANYSTLITGNAEDARTQMKRYITKYIQDRRIAVNGMSGEMLVNALYTEMAEYGFLTKYIFGSGIEEIDGATRS
jgi:pilus assembly protein CpaF